MPMVDTAGMQPLGGAIAVEVRDVDLSRPMYERGFQAIDHPVHPAIPETAYLKALFCRVPAT